MIYRLKLFALVFASIAGGMGGLYILFWLLIGFITFNLPQLDWSIARFIVAAAFLVATGLAIFEGGEDA